MPGPDDAARYHRLQLYLGLAGFALTAVYFLAVLASGASARLAHVASAHTWAWWVQVALVAAALGLGQAIVGFPLRVVRGFWLPRRFGLLHQPFTSWPPASARRRWRRCWRTSSAITSTATCGAGSSCRGRSRWSRSGWPRAC